jgi:hypothetical protein
VWVCQVWVLRVVEVRMCLEVAKREQTIDAVLIVVVADVRQCGLGVGVGVEVNGELEK